MSRVALLLVLAAAPALAQTAPPEELGRTLFQDGRRADGTALTAAAGSANLPLPAGFVACAHCHGDDARGRTEGGVTAGDIRAETLATPYAVALAGGRRRPTYDAASFATAVTHGRDAAGQSLNPAMPRYRLSGDEAAALFAYLGHIDHPTTDGVDDTTIRIGFVPAADPALAAATQRVLAARFAELNARGGLFRRRLVLVPLDAPAANTGTAHVLALLDDNLAAPARALPAHHPVLHAVAPPARSDTADSFAIFSAAADPTFSTLSIDARETYVRVLGGARPTDAEHAHQLTMLAAADFLLEALAQTGRALTAPRLVAALESTGEYRSGFGFIAGFSPTRHCAVALAPTEAATAPVARR